MNEWVGPDIAVVGPLEIPPSDEFPISESSHLFGKFTWQGAARRQANKTVEDHGALFSAKY